MARNQPGSLGVCFHCSPSLPEVQVSLGALCKAVMLPTAQEQAIHCSAEWKSVPVSLSQLMQANLGNSIGLHEKKKLKKIYSLIGSLAFSWKKTYNVRYHLRNHLLSVHLALKYGTFWYRSTDLLLQEQQWHRRAESSEAKNPPGQLCTTSFSHSCSYSRHTSKSCLILSSTLQLSWVNKQIT